MEEGTNTHMFIKLPHVHKIYLLNSPSVGVASPEVDEETGLDIVCLHSEIP